MKHLLYIVIFLWIFCYCCFEQRKAFQTQTLISCLLLEKSAFYTKILYFIIFYFLKSKKKSDLSKYFKMERAKKRGKKKEKRIIDMFSKNSSLLQPVFSSFRCFSTRARPPTKTATKTNELRKTTQLKRMLESPQLEYIMEAHSGLSAKIVENAGFKGIWASGLSLSAKLGVRDNNEASWTQVLEMLEFMSDASSIPILLDGDTGYGNFNNARRLVRKLEQRNIAGVCLEDKLFPKTNSFIEKEGGQPLADPMEFALKLKACKETQSDPDFVVVARCEAFIAGWGLDEMLQRAKLYADHGADAILVHSKRSDDAEIEAFMKKWDGRKPVVIVPTKYYKTPTKKFQDMGVSLVIWANHNLRASIKAMQHVSKRIYEEQSLLGVETDKLLVSVNDVFNLTGEPELEEAEKRYLPTQKLK
ncbi:hypothetical protein RFI_26820 [Reticulomyxa filosa]|uniref:phosphoenolpyruvate mutase n=1 Tax=Reticulomyxa filosa TaxID=46433 RepID=X6MBY6_RETFI|nr:hypothetical protein RFI_26820 [Reticulomyxa filosa]|eukprot:ETO10565.1 hypothetical protein RFI_26820 [Reticulomyxa filosa]